MSPETDFVRRQLAARKRAVIYCRVSTTKQEQDGESLEYQEEKCKGYAALHDIDVIMVLKEAKSGYIHYTLRDQLTLARQLVRDHMADIIMVWDLRRFSRNFVHSAMIFEEIESAGGQIISVSENIDNSLTGKLIRSILAWSAESEREKIVEYANRHWQTRFEHNLPVATGRPPYGWDWLDKEKTRYVIHPEHAAVRYSIFSMFVDQDMSLRKIANKLTEDGIPTPYSNQEGKEGYCVWHPSSIRKMLIDVENIGILRILKHTTITTEKGTKVKRVNPQTKMIPDGIPAIVPVEMYELAQLKLKNNQQDKSHLHTHPEDFLLKGHIVCKSCSHRMHGKYIKSGENLLPYYRCSNSLNAASGCPDQTYVRTYKLDELVWEECCKTFECLDMVRDTIESNIRSSLENLLEDSQGKAIINQLKSEIFFAEHEREKHPRNSYYYNLISADIHDKQGQLARYEQQQQESLNILRLSSIYEQNTLGFLNFLTSMRGRYQQATFAEKRNALDVLGVVAYVYPDTWEPQIIQLDVDKDWFSYKEISKLTGIPQRTLRVNIERGFIKTEKKTIVLDIVHRDEVERYMKTVNPDFDISLYSDEWFTVNRLSVLRIIHHTRLRRLMANREIAYQTKEITQTIISREEINRFLRERPIRPKSERENIQPRVEVQYSPLFSGEQHSLRKCSGSCAPTASINLSARPSSAASLALISGMTADQTSASL